MREQLISEPIKPVEGTMDVAAMARGEPGLPKKFIWRAEEHVIDEVLEKWKETSPCVSGADEQYVRKHWYRIRTCGGLQMKIYFERQPRSKRQQKARWWVYTLLLPED